MTYVFHILVGFSMVVFHTTIAPNSRWFAGFYDLLTVMVVYMGFFRSPREAIPFVLFFGMVMDVFSGGIFGLHATAYFWLYVSILGMTLFVVFPFTRLVHIASGFAAPVKYLARNYQIVRSR